MPTVQCPAEGFTHITVTYPDAWSYRHKLLFLRGVAQTPVDSTWYEDTLYGCIALCEKIEVAPTDEKPEGEDFEDIAGKPMWYAPFFEWLITEIWPKYRDAAAPPEKKISE